MVEDQDMNAEQPLISEHSRAGGVRAYRAIDVTGEIDNSSISERYALMMRDKVAASQTLVARRGHGNLRGELQH